MTEKAILGYVSVDVLRLIVVRILCAPKKQNTGGAEMLSQIRIYTINKGEMDAFLKHFKEEIMVVHERIGLPIVGTWVNRTQNEFIWVRNFTDAADREAKGKAFQAAVAAAGIKLGANVAKMEVRDAEPAFG